MVNGELRRLQRVEIDGLFGRYDHHFDLNTDERVTLLHGLNGVGKTTTLRMIDAFLRDELAYLASVPFDRMRLCFEDESTLELVPDTAEAPEPTAVVTLRELPSPPCEQKVSLSVRPPTRSPQAMPALPHGALPRALRDTPHQFNGFLASIDAHLVAEQRLNENGGVTRCSSHYQGLLKAIMSEYAQRAQELEETFPQRVVAASPSAELPFDQLRARLDTLAERMAQLKAMGIFKATDSHPVNATVSPDLDETRKRVLELYLQDAETKLKEVDHLAQCTRTFLDCLNGKFRDKSVRLADDGGLVAEDARCHRLALESLSSGEQHEFVLTYELLFRARRNSVVLIDEPEMSLHIGWQKQFLKDLLKIVELARVDAIVATHSPYIAGYRDDLLVGLGDPQ